MKRAALGRACAAAAAILSATRARAAPPADEVLDAPAPPTLPALAHRELTYTFEYTAASLRPKGGAPGDARAYAWFAHNDVELPVLPRRWYLGFAQDIAAASVPGTGTAILLGNPEVWGRGLWSSVLGLSSGGTLGVVLPIPRDLTRVQSAVLRTVQSVRPWDVAYFDDLTLTFRPSFDIRHVTGPLVFQMRQGVDASIPLRRTTPPGAPEPPNPIDLTARLTFYVGYRAIEWLGVGLEIWEVYQLTDPTITDEERAAFAVSPSARFLLPRVQPAVSLLLPIATPIGGEVASYVAARFNVGFAFDFALIRERGGGAR